MKTEQGEVLFAAVCDGMGGMVKGELASATVVLEMSDWFRQSFAVQKPGWVPPLLLFLYSRQGNICFYISEIPEYIN